MLQEVERESTEKFLRGYFDELSRKGYVKKDLVRRFIVWLFLVDFVERVYKLLTSDDYNKINDMMICLFNGMNCLLPYDQNRTHFNISDTVLQIFNLRATEDAMLRKTELDTIRIIEEQ